MADKEKIKNATKNAVSKVCDLNGNEVILTNNCRTDREDAHRSRNKFQQNICPTNLSEEGGGFDKSTGISWTRDPGNIGPIPYLTGYHKGDKCYRGAPTSEQTNSIKQNPEFRKNVDILGGNPDTVSPGFQCCYKPNGSVSPGSSFDYDYSGGNHKKLDVNPHDEFKIKPDGAEYEYGGHDDYDMSSGKSVDYTNEEDDFPW